MAVPQQSSPLKFIIAGAVVVAVIVWLAVSAGSQAKSYYVNIPELQGMGNKAYHENLRVDGFVQPGSIQQNGTNVTFVINEFESHNPKAGAGRVLKVTYKGSEPPPDTFKDDAQALAIGTYGRDGVFHATQLQAKCASKYAPAKPGVPGEPARGGGKPGESPTGNTTPMTTASATR